MCQQKKETMTLQDLKDNRQYIIDTITEHVGAENLNAVMGKMVDGLSCNDTIDELIQDAIYMALQFEVRIEKSKIAAMIANAHEDENYNPMTKDWEKA